MKIVKADIPIISFECPDCKEMWEVCLDRFEPSSESFQILIFDAECPDCNNSFQVELNLGEL